MHSSKKQQAPESFRGAPFDASASPSLSLGGERRRLTESTRTCIRRLNQLREGELAAAAAYDAFLSQQTGEGELELRLCQEMASHQRRANRLADLVSALGGQLQSEPGTWGFFESLAEPMAMAASETMALALLEEGERFGVREYQAALHRLDAHHRDVLEAELLPEQLRSFQEVAHLRAELRGQRHLGIS